VARRYQESYDYQEPGHQKLARCQVNDGTRSNVQAPNPNGSDQYDAGGPGDFVDVIEYYNHPLLTPLGLVRDPNTGVDRGFIQLQARRRAINESYRSAKTINVSIGGSGYATVTPMPPLPPAPSLTPTLTPSPEEPVIPPTATDVPPPTLTYTPTNTLEPTMTFTASITPTRVPTGQLLRLIWDHVPGSSMRNWKNRFRAPNYMNQANSCTFITRFESPSNWGSDYGEVVRGYILPPVTGLYTFWIASDDGSELWISTDDTPANVRQVAFVTSYTARNDFSSSNRGTNGRLERVNQKSDPIPMVGGNQYYVEAYHKEGSGGDNLSVAIVKLENLD